MFISIILEPLNQHCLCSGNLSVWLRENGTDHRWAVCYNNEALYWHQESLHQHRATTWHGKYNQDLLCNSCQCSSLGICQLGFLIYSCLSLRHGNNVDCWVQKTLVLFLFYIVETLSLFWQITAEWMQRKHWDPHQDTPAISSIMCLSV